MKKFMSLEECKAFIRINTPVARKPISKFAKQDLYPVFTSNSAFDQTVDCIAEAIYKRIGEDFGSSYYFDCWGKDGIVTTKMIRALNVENAKILFKEKYPEMAYDEPF